MGTILDFTFRHFDLLLICILIGLVTLILSVFVKKRMTLIIIMGVLIIGAAIVVNQLKYITLFDLYSDKLNENSDVKSVSISINEQVENKPLEIRTVNIEEEKIIEQILKDFSRIELKKDEDIQQHNRKYHIIIVVTNQIKEDHFSTTTIRLDIDDNYLNDYEIVSETNHLKTLETLAKDENLDWKY